ncbi:MAG: flavin reductase family protein [candidate division FCPU426 bacterium]
MPQYKSVPLDSAYRLINHGPVLLISSRSRRGRFDLAPIAWACPVGMEPCQVLLAMSPGHQTFRNIQAERGFIVCVPGKAQVKWVREAGSISGTQADKFAKFKIPSFPGKKVRAQIPQGTVAYLECNWQRTIRLKEVALVIGRCVHAAALAQAYQGRLRAEKPEGKTLHHLGGNVFMVPGDKLA